jgi:glycosyltransferase involved in cell wall biosynthesis
MKVLLFNTDDIQGGAARAAYRLHQGFQRINVSSQMAVQNKRVDQKTVLGASVSSGMANIIAGSRLTLGQLPLKFYRDRDPYAFYSLQWLPDNIASLTTQLNPDIVNLHWICNSYIQIETLAKLNKPLVWTLHDMWAFTGGCHYSDNCTSYTKSCGACPQLSSDRDWDLSRWVWQRKSRAWKNLNLTIVTPSSWLTKLAKSSSLFQDFRVETIANGIDAQVYRPIDRVWARELLRLPQDKHLIMFGSLSSTRNRRKGFHLLQPALLELSKTQWRDRLELVVFGASQPEHSPDLGFPTRYLGTFNDDLSLAIAYSAADVFVLPSLEDNLPNTLIEASSCGTPCVAFNVGGISDAIEHKQTGYLAEPYKTEDLAYGIKWAIESKLRNQQLSECARQKVEREFSLEIQAHKYLFLFKEISEKSNSFIKI